MNIQRTVLILAMLVFVGLAGQAWATMTISDYDPARHDRFYDPEPGDPPRAFIGESYDWSGVGVSWLWNSDGSKAYARWATMISPQYFLTAKHTPLAEEPTVTFHEGNSLDGPSHTYAIDDWSYTWGDLCLRRLTEPISENIAFYPIVDPGYSVSGKPFYCYGRGYVHPTDVEPDEPLENYYNPRVGKNEVSKVQFSTFNGSTTKCMKYYYNSSLPDECMLQPGDSGGPSFFDIDGEFALGGIHWYISTYSWDSLAPFYVDYYGDYGTEDVNTGIRTFVNGGDANRDGIVDVLDAVTLAINWERTDADWEHGDFNNDGCVDDADAALLSHNWLMQTTWSRSVDLTTPIAVGTAVPEPAVAALLLSGLMVLLFRRLRAVE